MPTIKFTDTTGLVPEQFYPKPASRFIPEWLKALKPYGEDKKHRQLSPHDSNRTAKKCHPMVDAAMTGYVIETTEDWIVEQTDQGAHFYWANGLGLDFHEPGQISTHSRSSEMVPKWMNPFAIETPAGYSTLFIPLVNQDNPVIVPFSGMVDTDSFIHNVNFPFLLRDPDFEGLIPAGTPLVQVIPVKRVEWTKAVHSGETDAITRSQRLSTSVFLNGYKMFFRKPKSYR